jgi:hypothetical protein
MTQEELKTELDKIEHELKQLRKLAALLQSAWHYGDWKAETLNEHEMETIMIEQGLWPVTLSAHTFEPNLKQYPSEMNGGDNNMKYKVIETRKATMIFEYEVEAPSEEQAVQLANEYVTPYNAYVNVDEGEEFDMEVEPWNDDIEQSRKTERETNL